MTTKEELTNIIKDWVTIDNEIKVLQKEMCKRIGRGRKAQES